LLVFLCAGDSYGKYGYKGQHRSRDVCIPIAVLRIDFHWFTF
jgi:hypothetical protein